MFQGFPAFLFASTVKDGSVTQTCGKIYPEERKKVLTRRLGEFIFVFK